MKYYTKEWYALMQKQHYTSGLAVILDKEYTDTEIEAFFAEDLQDEIEHDRSIHDMPPSMEWAEDLLVPEHFRSETFLFVNDDGESFHPETAEIAREYLEKEFQRQTEQYEKREPFDPTDTVACFKECYRMMVCHGWKGYPEWVSGTVDMRLLALHRIPESAYKRLLDEEQANKAAFEQMTEEAYAALKEQDIPDEIRELFRFHDANVLSIKKKGADVEMLLRDGGFMKAPYCRVIFHNVTRYERKKGIVIRAKREDSGKYSSNVVYLYDELYRTKSGYEIHMMLSGRRRQDMRYMTVWCERIEVQTCEPYHTLL